MSTSPRILAFAGSARKESFNKKLLAAVVAEVRSAGGEATVLDLNDLPIPLYHGDLEDAQGMPENAQKFIKLVTEHHALLIATPEYNSQMPPLLKNTIDWATRGDENPLIGKVAAVVSASPGAFGAIRSMTLCRALFVHLGCHVLPTQCILPHADKAFDAQGKLTVAQTQKAAAAVGKGIVELARKIHAL